MKYSSDLLNVWGPGKLMAFSGLDGKTDYEKSLVLRSGFDKTCTLEIKLPGEVSETEENSSGKIILLQKEIPDDAIFGGDFLVINNTKGAFVDAYHFLVRGPVKIEHIDHSSIKIAQSEDLYLIGVANHFNKDFLKSDIDTVIKKRAKWVFSQNIPVGINTNSKRTLYQAFSQLKTQIYSPEGQFKHLWSTPDRWPHRRIWLWDSVFHAIGARHLDAALARDLLDSVFDYQHENGFIALDATPDSTNRVTQPPVLALGVKLVLQSEEDQNWLRKCYPKLCKYLLWDFANRDKDGYGLLEWATEDNPNCRSGESGADNSPRFDHNQKLDATDFNSYIALECEIMVEFAEKLNLPLEVEAWQSRHQKLCTLINQRLWNEELGFYFDYDIEQHYQLQIFSNSGFLPLICGAASHEQAQKLAEHLHDPDSFGTAMPIPSVAAKSASLYNKDMWRGPVWVNINYLIAMGFARYNMQNEVDLIIDKTQAMLENNYLKYGTFFEFVDDRNEVSPPHLPRKGKNKANTFFQSFHDFGWSATLYIDILFSKMGKQL